MPKTVRLALLGTVLVLACAAFLFLNTQGSPPPVKFSITVVDVSGK
jgi:hypothetical protein